MQVLLKRLLHAGFTDECIHRVTLFAVFIGFRAPNWTDVAENVRGVLRVIFAHRAVFDHDARHGQLHDGGEGFRVDVLRQRVVFQTDALDRAQLQLVPDGDDAVDVRLLPVVGDLVFAAQALHERGRGDIEVIAAVGKELAEIVLPGRIVVVGIFVRPVRGNREVRLVLDPELVAKVQHLQKIPVRVRRVEEDEVDDDEVIARAVGDQHVAVAVQNIAARSLDRRLIGHGVGVGGDEGFLGDGRLRLVKPQGEHDDHGQNDDDEHDHAEAGDSLHLFGTNLSDRPGSQVDERAGEQTQADLDGQRVDRADVDRAEIALEQE